MAVADGLRRPEQDGVILGGALERARGDPSASTTSVTHRRLLRLGVCVIVKKVVGLRQRDVCAHKVGAPVVVGFLNMQGSPAAGSSGYDSSAGRKAALPQSEAWGRTRR